MILAARYTNNRGQSIEFGGSEEYLHQFENSIRDAKWDYDTAYGSVTDFFHDPVELELKIGIAADTEDEGLALRDRIATIAECDVLDKKAGQLEINGWHLNCFIIARAYEEWWWDGRICEITLTVLALEQVWYREKVYHFDTTDSESSGYTYLDFPYDFAYDLNSGKSKIKQLLNASLAPADVILRMYGAAENPYINIAGNTYGVNATVEIGEYIEIDTKAQTVELVKQFGERSNLFAKRYPGGETSDQYIFAKVPAGYLTASSDNTFAYDITIREFKSEPEWSANE